MSKERWRSRAGRQNAMKRAKMQFISVKGAFCTDMIMLLELNAVILQSVRYVVRCTEECRDVHDDT